VPIVLKSGSLNRLEIPGPVQACNGIALPLPLPIALEVILSLSMKGSYNFEGCADIDLH
jgi:hypothetical protein